METFEFLFYFIWRFGFIFHYLRNRFNRLSHIVGEDNPFFDLFYKNIWDVFGPWFYIRGGGCNVGSP